MNLSGDKMIIYADVLIFTNTIIDYFLLTITSFIVKKSVKPILMIFASLFGGVISLYIFIESKSLLFDIMFKFVSGIILIIIAFGFSNLKNFLLRYVFFLVLSFSFNGLVLFINNLNSSTFLSRNLISYIDISPVFLVLLSAIFYLLIRITEKILHRKVQVDCAEIEIEIFDICTKFNALIDSGHTLTDPLSDSQIIIIDESLYNVFTNINKNITNRIRLIPVTTISNSEIVRGIRCDKATVYIGKEIIELKSPIILPASKKLGDNYNAIISKTAVNII